MLLILFRLARISSWFCVVVMVVAVAAARPAPLILPSLHKLSCCCETFTVDAVKQAGVYWIFGGREPATLPRPLPRPMPRLTTVLQTTLQRSASFESQIESSTPYGGYTEQFEASFWHRLQQQHGGQQQQQLMQHQEQGSDKSSSSSSSSSSTWWCCYARLQEAG